MANAATGCDMPKDARRMLEVMYVLSGGVEGVPIERSVMDVLGSIAIAMTDDAYEASWGVMARSIVARKRAAP